MWIQHVQNTRKLNPTLMQEGGLKAVIMKAKESYAAVKSQNAKKQQNGGMGCPMGGATEKMIDNSAEVSGSADRAVGAGAVEAPSMEGPHTMMGGKSNKSGKSKKSKKGGKSMKSGKSKKSKKGGKSMKSKKGGKSKKSKKSNKSKKSMKSRR